MTKRYQIVVDLDTRPGVSAAERMGATFVRLEDRIGRSVGRTEAAQKAAAERSAAAAEKLAEKAAARMEAVADRVVVRDEKRRRAATESAERQARRDADRAEQQERRKADRLEAIQDNFTRRDARRRAAYEAQRERDAEATAGRMEARIKGLSLGALGFGLAVAGQLSEIYNKIDQKAKEAADATLEARKRLRVEAALVGTDTRSGKQLLDAAVFRTQTGLGDTEASDFVRQFQGSTSVGLQKFAATGGKEGMSQQVADKLKIQAGIRAARIGGDAYTHGELAGLLGQFGPIKDEQQGLAKLEAIRIALTEGRGDDTPLTKQLLKAAGTMVKEGGPVETLEELGAVIGTTSLGNPEEAAMFALQSSRAVRRGLGKQRKIKGAKETQSAYLKNKLKITEHTSYEDAMIAIGKDLTEGEGKGRDPSVYLTEHGFGSDEEIRAVVQITNNLDAFKARMKAVRASQATLGPEQVTKNKQFVAGPEGRNAIAEATTEAQRHAIGLKAERFRLLQKEAEAQAGDMDPTAATQVGDFFRGLSTGVSGLNVVGLSFLGESTLEKGRKNRVDAIALQKLRSRAKRAGISDEELGNARVRSYGKDVPFEAEYANQVERMIEAKGGSTAVDSTAALSSLEDAVRQNTDALKKSDKQPKGAVPDKQLPPAVPRPPKGEAHVL